MGPSHGTLIAIGLRIATSWEGTRVAKSAHASVQARRQFTVLTGPKNFISDLGEMTMLTGQVIKMAVRGPQDYWG